MTDTVPRADRPRIAVLTAVSGQHGHLLNHVDGLALSTWPPDMHVVVSIGDRELTRGRIPITSDRWSTTVPRLPGRKRRSQFLPSVDLAARQATQDGADVLVYLAVDCIPDPRLLQLLAESVLEAPACTPSVSVPAVAPLRESRVPGPYPVATGLAALTTPPTSTGAGPAPPLTDTVTALSAAFATTPATWEMVSSCLSAWCPHGGAPADLLDILAKESVELQDVPGGTAYRQHPSGASLTFRGTPRTVVLRNQVCEAWRSEAVS